MENSLLHLFDFHMMKQLSFFFFERGERRSLVDVDLNNVSTLPQKSFALLSQWIFPLRTFVPFQRVGEIIFTFYFYIHFHFSFLFLFYSRYFICLGIYFFCILIHFIGLLNIFYATDIFSAYLWILTIRENECCCWASRKFLRSCSIVEACKSYV